MKKEDVKPQVKAVARQFTKELVSEVTRESTKKLIRGLKKEKKAELEAELKNLSNDEIEKCLEMKPEFNKAFENTIGSIKEASLEKIQLGFEENFSSCLPPAPASFVGKTISWIKPTGNLGLIGAASLAILAVILFALPIAAPNPDDGIEGWSNINTPSFNWSEPESMLDIVGYFYRVDDGTEIYTTSTTVTLPEQKDGNYTLYVRAKDYLGLKGSVGSHKFKIDTTSPPAPNPDDSVSDWSSNNTPTFSWNKSSDISGISGYYFWVDDGPKKWTTSISVTLSPQAEGPHIFYIMAKDNAENNGSYGSHEFEIDTTNPPPPIPDDKFNGWSNNSMPTFWWSAPVHASGIAVYHYRVDNGPESYTTSTTLTLPKQNDGTHLFYVWAQDNAGHIGDAIFHEFTIDTTNPPPPTPDDGVSDWSNNNKPTFNWSVPGDLSGIAGYYYKVGSEGPETYTTSTYVTLPQQTDGILTFYVRAQDKAGNNGSYGSHQFKIDTT